MFNDISNICVMMPNIGPVENHKITENGVSRIALKEAGFLPGVQTPHIFGHTILVLVHTWHFPL